MNSRIRRRVALSVIGAMWFAMWAWIPAPSIGRATPNRPCLQAEVRHHGSGWSSPLPLREADRRVGDRLEGAIGDPTPPPFSVRLAHLDTADVPQLIQCIGQALGVDVRTALSVALCESHFDPQARNGVYVGVFQIHEDLFAETARALGLGSPDPTDAWTNVFVALSIVRREGWSRWSCA